MVVEWAVLMPLAIYLEQVIDDKAGVRRHPLYIFEWCGLWKPKQVDEAQEEYAHQHQNGNGAINGAHRHGKKEEVSIVMDNEDVAAERVRALELTREDAKDYPIIVHGLRKVYPAQAGGVKKKVAVRDLNLAVERGECFGLLGPNGAGKTTSITMLVGFQEPTSGTALVDGYDIRTEMGLIYSRMGEQAPSPSWAKLFCCNSLIFTRGRRRCV